METWYKNTARLVNNGAIHFPSLARIPRTPTLLSKCRLKTVKEEDQEWMEALWKNETQALVFYVYDEEQCKRSDAYDGEIVYIAVTTEEDELLIQYRGYPQGSERQDPMIFAPRLSEVFKTMEDVDLFLARILHSFLRTNAHMLPSHVLWDLMTNFLGLTIGNLTSKQYKKVSLISEAILCTFLRPLTLTISGLLGLAATSS